MTVWAVLQKNGAVESLWRSEQLAKSYVEGLPNKLLIKQYYINEEVISPIPKEMAYDCN